MSTATKSKRSTRIYEAGRPTTGWRRGEQITDYTQVKPGDVLIAVSHQFKAENLVRVVKRELPFPPGFDYEYVDCKTLRHSDGHTMFCWNFELAGPQHAYYRALDRRPVRRIRNLPSFLYYPKRNRRQ
jgi:hypothetical protein